MQCPGPAVDVEVVLIRLHQRTLWYRFVRRPVTGAEPPDELALQLAPVTGSGVCHSTSWRFESGVVVLTYAVLPDPVPALPGSALHAPAVVCSGDPQRPGPVGMHAHHVAAHAVRHLAYLAGTDPTIIAIADADGPDGCWATVRSVGARTPAATHVAVHRLAGRRPAPC